MSTGDQEVFDRRVRGNFFYSNGLGIRSICAHFDVTARFAAELWRLGLCSRRCMLQGDEVDRITERVISCAIEVHRTMGPGLLESIYQECLLVELGREGLSAECERAVPVDYKGRRLISRFVIDLLVERAVVVEVKAIESVKPVHKAQVISYLRLSGVPAGLLINFNNTTLAAGISRLDHPDRYVRRGTTKVEQPKE